MTFDDRINPYMYHLTDHNPLFFPTVPPTQERLFEDDWPEIRVWIELNHGEWHHKPWDFLELVAYKSWLTGRKSWGKQQ